MPFRLLKLQITKLQHVINNLILTINTIMVDSSQVQTSLKHFLPMSKLGQGSFSTVYKVKRIKDGKIYALKKIKINQLKQKDKNNSLNQIRILASFKSKYVISYKQAFYDSQLGLLCIVMEYANEGDLQKKIQINKSKRQFFKQSQIWRAVVHILNGLNQLHQKGILHRDLKSANIFISDNIYKLGDLNVSKLAYTQTGTPYYASPQVWRDQPYNHKSDIWSFGCLIYQMCAFSPPFKGSNLDELYKLVQKGKFVSISTTFSINLGMFISKCLKIDPYQRPSAKQLLKLIPIQQKHFLADSQQNSNQYQLMRTIKLPLNINDLSFPISKYESCRQKNDLQNQSQINNSSQKYLNNQKLKIVVKKKRQNILLRQRIKQNLQDITSSEPVKPLRPQSRVKTTHNAERRGLKSYQNIKTQQNRQSHQQINKIKRQNKKIRPISCNINKKNNFQKQENYVKKTEQNVQNKCSDYLLKNNAKIVNYIYFKQLNNNQILKDKRIQQNSKNAKRFDYIKEYDLQKNRNNLKSQIRMSQDSLNQKYYLQKSKDYQRKYKDLQKRINLFKSPKQYIKQKKIRCQSAIVTIIKANDSQNHMKNIKIRLQNRKMNLINNRNRGCLSAQNKIKATYYPNYNYFDDINKSKAQCSYNRIISDPRIRPIINKSRYNFQRIVPLSKHCIEKNLDQKSIIGKLKYQNLNQINKSSFIQGVSAQELIMNDVSNLRKILKGRHQNIDKIN